MKYTNSLSLSSQTPGNTIWHHRSGRHFNTGHELLNLRALKFSPVNKIHIFQCICKICWFQRVPLQLHTQYLTHTLKDVIFRQHLILWALRFNTLRPIQNGRRFADDTFERIFSNENVRISIKISLKFVSKGPINNIPALVQIMAWRRSGDKPVSEPMMVSLLAHLCVTRPQWVKSS